MALGNRYEPPHPIGEVCNFGIDYSAILPLGVIITDADLDIMINTNPPGAQTAWTIGAVEIDGRRVYAQCSGGAAGTDYQFQWVATDSLGNTWPRTILCLCAQTN